MIAYDRDIKIALEFLAMFFICVVSVFIIGFGNVKANAATSGDFTYTVLSDGTVEITDYTGLASSLTIPSEIEGYMVTKIGDNAFDECKCLDQVIIPTGVTSIGNKAFYFCTNMLKITIPNSVVSIGEYAFSDCIRLNNVTLPDSIVIMEKGAFADCDSLTSIAIPNGMTILNDEVFSGCDSLVNILISDFGVLILPI